jgi:hypothetical protein
MMLPARSQRRRTNSRGRSRSQWLSWACRASIVAWLLPAYLAAAPSSRVEEMACDASKPTRVVVEGAVFWVPASYFFNSEHARDSKVKGVNLAAILPNLKPYQCATREESECRGFCERVYFSIEARGAHLTVSDYLDQVIRGDRLKGRFTGNAVHGLQEIASRDERHDFWAFTTSAGTQVFLRCTKEGQVAFPGCSGFLDISPLHILNISFGRNQLGTAVDLTERIIAMVRGFRAKDN